MNTFNNIRLQMREPSIVVPPTSPFTTYRILLVLTAFAFFFPPYLPKVHRSFQLPCFDKYNLTSPPRMVKYCCTNIMSRYKLPSLVYSEIVIENCCILWLMNREFLNYFNLCRMDFLHIRGRNCKTKTTGRKAPLFAVFKVNLSNVSCTRASISFLSHSSRVSFIYGRNSWCVKNAGFYGFRLIWDYNTGTQSLASN
jgi:hypothetical protein